MHLSSQRLLIIGVLAEAAIWLVSYFLTDAISETFRLAARFSGRLSAFVFLFTFFQYVGAYRSPDKSFLRKYLALFAVLHVIHWGFLATNVYLNSVPLETHKLIGGGLAYLMVVLAPFRLLKLKTAWQLVYFYYVTFIMIMTYVARIKGEFQGVEPYWWHYTMLSVLITWTLVSGRMMYRARA
ncbi:MAG TPA: hypothetical protein DCE41_29420 [Cytophagales bacterium]|nr:hypothetical protein [Cytophagales bacterium]HAA17410.1 hypothetical protein [Cytophagales bacterium]HAP58561.1 hypothetical protein [Cytophagales bacterium]